MNHMTKLFLYTLVIPGAIAAAACVYETCTDKSYSCNAALCHIELHCDRPRDEVIREMERDQILDRETESEREYREWNEERQEREKENPWRDHV